MRFLAALGMTNPGRYSLDSPLARPVPGRGMLGVWPRRSRTTAQAADPSGYDKRSMSEAVLGLLDSLGVAERFVVVGHDRGARVARRMAADHPERVVGAALLDIMPLEWVFDQGSAGYARRYYHWYFMLQRGIAEAAMGAVPRAFAINQFERAHVPLDPAAVEHYVEMF